MASELSIFVFDLDSFRDEHVFVLAFDTLAIVASSLLVTNVVEVLSGKIPVGAILLLEIWVVLEVALSLNVGESVSTISVTSFEESPAVVVLSGEVNSELVCLGSPLWDLLSVFGWLSKSGSDEVGVSSEVALSIFDGHLFVAELVSSLLDAQLLPVFNQLFGVVAI